ncbi:hypothetical protein J3R03_008508 [Actinoplanes couchii]|nr:hypothetical protein [Actinoplanes couchii]
MSWPSEVGPLEVGLRVGCRGRRAGVGRWGSVSGDELG